MNVTSRRLFFKSFSLMYGLLRMAGAALCAILLVFALSHTAASGEIPPAAEKKSVFLNKSRTEAERVFAIACGKCHASPNPAKTASVRPDCTKGLSEGDRAQAQSYMADVRKGKSLYESHCGRCHDLIAPGSHTREYWSKNVCTSEECFIEKLKDEEEQQLLLYLSSQAKKN
jgi:cytochrome c5